ncbi:unnamed protein product [Cyclocybe aegerita]|uniref:Man(5)GlcNAc(2)-PP-dolichol translocation protein RFT1 n=1 Tax=Cyclocybe aegerita TaxID=1973307 RepID=A0A8S0WYD5_CYCAE|nr:unnamed protein product [Cyclocybe aegerita]
MSTAPPPSSGLLASSIASASSLVALQAFSRLFTFALNQALFRLASPSAFGAAAIQFELVLSTILFLSREGVRNALLRASYSDSSSDTAIRRANVAFVPVAVGIPLALGTSVVYARHASGEMRAQPGFDGAVAVYALAAVVELLSEPFYNVAMTSLKTGVRVRAEGLGITFKSVTTFLVLLYDSRWGSGDLALLAFALGQLVYSAVMFGAYLLYLGSEYVRPKSPSSSKPSLLSYFDHDVLRLSLTMTTQSLVKHFLTEGDKMILSWFSPLHDQGGYAIAVNYGSLIARIIFQPIEETLRLFFSRTLGSSTTSDSSTTIKFKSNTEEPQLELLQAASTLRSLLSVQLSFSLILLVFGTAYLPVLLPLLLPRQYLATSAPSVLTAWVWYIPVLAVNGGLEAFLSSVASSKDLNEQSRWMVGFSTVYILSAISLYRLGFGDASLVYANILNLSARIVYCLRFATSFFMHSKPTSLNSKPLFRWQDTLPPKSLFAISAFSAIVVYASDVRLGTDALTAKLGRAALTNPSVVLHVGLGGLLTVGCLLMWWVSAGQYLKLPSQHKKME